MKYALLVIDMQNDFIKNSSAYSCQMLDKNLIDRVKRLIEFSRGKGIHIIYTMHSIMPDKSNAELGEPIDVRICIAGTKGWKIIDDISPNDSDYILRKDKYDAFYGTELEYLLKRYEIDTVIICGVLTNNCVRATAEGAHYRDFKIIIVKDCCGATSYISHMTHEQIHYITLKDLKGRMYDTRLVKLDEILLNRILA